MRAALLVVVLAVVGCHKDGGAPAPSGPASTSEQDALWKLAPEGAMFGIVVSPHAMEMIEHGWLDIDAFTHAAPELKEYADKMDAELQRSTGSTKPSFATLGVSTKKGFAMFMGADKKPVFILPIENRDAFVKLVHGTKGDKQDKLDEHTTCQVMNGNYVCVEDVASFDKLGKGQLSASAANGRGDIEMVGKDLPMARDMPLSFAAVIQLTRGAFTMRGAVTGIPKQVLTAMGEASKPRLDGDKTTGFGLLHLKSVFAALPMPDSAQKMFATLGDPVSVVTYSNKLDAQLPLLDSGPAAMIVNACGDGPLAKLGAKAVNGVCSFAVPNAPAMMVALSIDGKTLHAGMTLPGPANSAELTGFGKELADGSWQDAFWGHGSLLASDQNLATQFAAMPVPIDMSVFNVAIRAMTMLDEFGVAARIDGDALRFELGLRTAWSNPDDIVAKLVAITPADVLAGKGPSLAAAFATKGSPLENDLKAGYSGMMIPMSGVGVMAAVAVPAFLEYVKRSKTSAASQNLNRIGKAAKMVYAETAAFPVGDSALLPAGATCCGQPAARCAADPAAFAKDPVWSKLEFSIDEPSIYQYRYHSADGKTFTVEAISDADCDGNMATMKLEGSIGADNNPHTVIIPPPSGVY